MSTDIRSIVRENLRDALEGGYEELAAWSSADVANDLIAYAADCDSYTPEYLIPHIDEFFGRTPCHKPSV